MKIKESKNLRYDKKAKVASASDDYDYLDFQPRVCVLENIERRDDILMLHFKNRTWATIKAHNVEGGREIDLIETKLARLIGRSYEEILESEI